jgi:hypothetical protein
MADALKNIEKKEETPSQPSVVPASPMAAPSSVNASRQEIAGTLEGEKGGEMMTEVERVSEQARESKEIKGDSAGGQQPKKDDGTTGQTAAATTAFTFDEKNLPAVPEMIKRIEDQLRAEIRKLERDARRYQGGILRKPDLPKYSATIIEIRKKNVLMKRLFSMAGDMIKKMFLHMFGKQKA